LALEILYWSPGSGGHRYNLLGLDYKIVIDVDNLSAQLIPSEEDSWKPTHQHFKGGYYKVTSVGRMFVDGDEPIIMVEYENEAGVKFARSLDNFNKEGKFNEIRSY
jgi:hypothetical protein